MQQLTLGALAGAATFGVLASPASAAQTQTLTYKCKYPLIGTNPLSVKFDLDIPDTWQRDEPTPPFAMTAEATASGNTVPGLSLIEGLASLEGVATATSTVTHPGSAATVVKLPITIPTYVLPTPVPDPLVLTGAGVTPPLTFDVEGLATIKFDSFALELTAKDAAGEPIILPPVSKEIDVPPGPSDPTPETFDVLCKLDPGQNTTLATITVNGPMNDSSEPPTTPNEGILTEADFTPTSINLKWTASTDNVGVKEYVIRYDDREIRVPAGTLTKKLEGLAPDSEYFVTIIAVDLSGNESAPLELFYVTPPVLPCDCPPSQPGTPALSTATTTSLTFSWAAATGLKPVVGYDVYKDGVKVMTVTGTSATITGLAPDTDYSIKVAAIDNGSPPLMTTSAAASLKTARPTPPLPVKYAYSLAGTASLKNMTRGTLPLKGAIAAELTLATGAFTADLTLNQTQGRLTALGFLPVTAKIGFVPSGKTTGTLLDGVLKTSSLVRIKVLEVKLFGAIPLAGGNNCQTKSLSKIDLKSTQAEFSPLAGGPIAGTFAISDLNGCGALNGVVSPLTAGGGNTINLNLTPKA